MMIVVFVQEGDLRDESGDGGRASRALVAAGAGALAVAPQGLRELTKGGLVKGDIEKEI